MLCTISSMLVGKCSFSLCDTLYIGEMFLRVDGTLNNTCGLLFIPYSAWVYIVYEGILMKFRKMTVRIVFAHLIFAKYLELA